MRESIDRTSFRPQRVESDSLENFLKDNTRVGIIDQYRRNLEELFLLRNPSYRFDKNYQIAFEEFFQIQTKGNSYAAGTWFYYPWLHQLIHFLPDEMHQELRTGRNRNLITKEEQEKYYHAKITVLGMSVGSHVAETIAMTGGSRSMNLADPDTYSGDNLNRIRTGFQNVGMSKAVVVARKLYEIDPYAEHSVYTEGLTEQNVEEILDKSGVIAEEMDNLYWKLKIRELARQRGIPVIMGTDNGDGTIVDIERFDIDQSYPILHNTIEGLTAEQCRYISPSELPAVYAKVSGAELAVPRMLESVAEVGKTLYSWPQLGTAANLCGTVVAYLARRIVLKDPSIKSGRYEVSLDSIFESGYNEKEGERKRAFENFVEKMRYKTEGR